MFTCIRQHSCFPLVADGRGGGLLTGRGAIRKARLDVRAFGCSGFSFGRDHQRQNAESPCRERQRSRWKRNGPVGRPSSVGGSGRAWLSAAPIRNSRSMVVSGGVGRCRWPHSGIGRPHRGVNCMTFVCLCSRAGRRYSVHTPMRSHREDRAVNVSADVALVVQTARSSSQHSA